MTRYIFKFETESCKEYKWEIKKTDEKIYLYDKIFD
jgi:hypothetical protein